MQVDLAHHCARKYILQKEDPPFLECRFVSDEIGAFIITNSMHFWGKLLTAYTLVVCTCTIILEYFLYTCKLLAE